MRHRSVENGTKKQRNKETKKQRNKEMDVLNCLTALGKTQRVTRGNAWECISRQGVNSRKSGSGRMVVYRGWLWLAIQVPPTIKSNVPLMVQSVEDVKAIRGLSARDQHDMVAHIIGLDWV